MTSSCPPSQVVTTSGLPSPVTSSTLRLRNSSPGREACVTASAPPARRSASRSSIAPSPPRTTSATAESPSAAGSTRCRRTSSFSLRIEPTPASPDGPDAPAAAPAFARHPVPAIASAQARANAHESLGTAPATP